MGDKGGVVSIIGQRLAEAMELRGVSQSDLAQGIEVTQGAVSKIIVGKTANSRLLPKIATYLGVPLPWLLGQSDQFEDGEVEDFSSAERDWVANLRALKPEDRCAIMTLVRSLSRSARTPTLHDDQHEYRAAG